MRPITRWVVRALLSISLALSVAAPVGGPLTVPAVAAPAGQQRMEFAVPGDHPVTVPREATAVQVTLSGAGAPGRGGAVVEARAAVSPSGPIRPGDALTVHIDGGGTDLRRAGAPLFATLLLAPAAGGNGQGQSDPAVFPEPATRPTASTGPGRALVVFTVPLAAVGGLPESVDMGVTLIGTPVVRGISVRSAGDAPLSLTGITATAPFAVENRGTTCVTGPASRVAPGSTCTVAVQFTATARGAATGTLSLFGNVPGGVVTVALKGGGGGVPAPPTSVTATAGPAQVALSWMPPADDGGHPVTGFQISRSTGTDAAGAAVVATVDPGTLLWTDTGLTDGETYAYVVRAVSELGVSEPSAPATAVPTAGLSVSTTALPGGIVGMPYRAAVAAAGGVAPFRWSADGGLPAGLELNPETGEITGTPTTAGGSVVEVKVADSALPTRAEAVARLSITVAAAPQGPPPAGAPAALVPVDSVAHGSGGIGLDVWLWAVVGLAGLAVGGVAVHRLRGRKAGTGTAG